VIAVGARRRFDRPPGRGVHAHVEAEIADVDMEQLSPCAVDGSATSSAAGYGRGS
jgi:hypothetical protein